MSAVLLQTTPGTSVNEDTLITPAVLNQLANPLVEIPPGANIGPEQLDMGSIGAQLGVGATGQNLVLWGDLYPTGWRAATVSAPAGVRTENARGIWVRPAGAAIDYNRQQAAPDELSAWSAYFGGAVGLTALESGTYLGPDATSKLVDTPFVVSVSLKNAGNADFRPTLEIRTSNLLQDEDNVTMRVTQQADDPVTVGTWRRFTWLLNSTGLQNWINGAQIVFRMEAFPNPAHHILLAQVDVRRGTSAAAFSVAPRETLQTGAVPVGTLLPVAGEIAVPDPGFLFANGAAVSRNTYGSLFARTGTRYGVGNGVSTFNLPDLRERRLVGASTMGGSLVGAGRGILTVDQCSITTGSQVVTLGGAGADIPVGSLVIAEGVPAGTQVIGSDNATTIYLSAAATATTVGTLTMIFSPLGVDLRAPGSASPDLIHSESRYQVGALISRLGTGSNGNQRLRVYHSGLGYSSIDIYVGMIVIGVGIPSGTVVEALYDLDEIWLSKAKTAALNLDPVLFLEPGATAAERARWRERIALEPVIQNCSTTNASLTVTVPSHLTRQLVPGMGVSGNGIPAGATISNLLSATQFQLSAAATNTGSGKTLSFTHPPEYLTTRLYQSHMSCLWQIKT